MEKLKEFLESIGLKGKEADVYIAALKYGSQTASVLAKKTNLPRSTVNFVLKTLIQKGFAAKDIRNKSTYFNALQPEYIENILLGKLASAKKSMSDLKDMMPLLNGIRNDFTAPVKVQYFDGVEGLCRMLDDFAARDQEVLYISSHNNMHPTIREYVYSVYLPICDKQENKNKIILHEGELSREYEKKAKNSYNEFIFVNSDAYELTLTTAIYGDKTAFWSYDPSDMSGIIIQNKLIAANMRTVFSVFKSFFGK